MAALAQSIGKRDSAAASAATDVVLVILGSLLVGLLAQVSVRLPFTPIPITGQTLGVLLVGASLGALRGGMSLLLYLVWGVVGLPFFAEGRSGAEILSLATASGGFLWGFVAAAVIVGRLADRGWDRSLGSSIGAMLIGEIVIFSFGVPWLAAAAGLSAEEALAQGLYPFVLGDLLKLLLVAGALPLAWKLLGDGRHP